MKFLKLLWFRWKYRKLIRLRNKLQDEICRITTQDRAKLLYEAHSIEKDKR